MSRLSVPESNNADAPDPWSDDGDFLSEIIETQSDVAAVELDLQTILRIVAERTQRLTAADGASVQLIEGDHLTLRAVSGIMLGRVGMMLSMTQSLSGTVATTRQHLYCEDTELDPRVDHPLANSMQIRSLILVPIFQGTQVVGVLNVSSQRTSAFTHRNVSALRLMAGLVAAALGHASEFEVKKQLLAQRTIALAALRESEERFRSSFEYAAIGMAIVGIDGRWRQVNRAICQILGYAEHELLATNFQSITHPPDLDTDLEYVRQLLAGNISDYQMVKRYIHRKGHLIWVMLNVSLVRSGEGDPIYFISQVQDITGRMQVEEALRRSEEEFRSMFELAGIGAAEADLVTGRYVRVNRKLCEMLGYTTEELCSMPISKFTHTEDHPLTEQVLDRMRAGAIGEHTAEKRYIHKSGRIVWAILNATVIYDSTGRPIRGVGTMQDITERKRAEWLEQDRRRVLEMVAKDLPLPEVLTRLAAVIDRQLCCAATAVTVLQDGEVQIYAPTLPVDWSDGVRLRALSLSTHLSRGSWDSSDSCGVTYLQSDAAWKELRPIAAAHGLQCCWTIAIKATDETPLGLLTIFSREMRCPSAGEIATFDMASKLATICIEHHNTTRQLAHLVRHDSLTSLPNRIMFEDRLQQGMSMARRSGKAMALMLIDIDHFKSINDTLGHDAGDHLLQQFAHRLRSRLRDTDTMARIGGDEFAVVLPELGNIDDTQLIAKKLLDCLVEPFGLTERKMLVTASIGIAVFPRDSEDGVTLQKKADMALYRAKEHGRNGFSF
jgi:diguanylate cyclase (GGDEF)-like protein/PAS domain S-box-containing protein